VVSFKAANGTQIPVPAIANSTLCNATFYYAYDAYTTVLATTSNSSMNNQSLPPLLTIRTCRHAGHVANGVGYADQCDSCDKHVDSGKRKLLRAVRQFLHRAGMFVSCSTQMWTHIVTVLQQTNGAMNITYMTIYAFPPDTSVLPYLTTGTLRLYPLTTNPVFNGSVATGSNNYVSVQGAGDRGCCIDCADGERGTQFHVQSVHERTTAQHGHVQR
jgi:hypothetical protein